jgi:transcriptional regulator with XRE-family HTH domain
MKGKDYDFGKIATHRRAAGITQEEMAQRLGVVPMTVWRIEHGRHCGFPLLMKIARELNLDWKRLILNPSASERSTE